jgi:tRNA-specific 2-thiouridylase
MRILVAMSGGVDSSVAAYLLREAGHEVVGVTLKLWGGETDSGCCSVSDVEDARAVARRLGIAHRVLNLTDSFDANVVEPYVSMYGQGLTPNPCVECNRSIKFRALLATALRLGFDRLATGHYARVTRTSSGKWALLRAADPAKDQSYVLSVLTAEALPHLIFPLGELTKSQVRDIARSAGLPVASKADSQEVCFVPRGEDGRRRFLGARLRLRPSTLVEAGSGRVLGQGPPIQLLTVGQRRGIPPGPVGERRYVVEVDPARHAVIVGRLEDLLTERLSIAHTTFTGDPLEPGSKVLVQGSAHARPVPATYESDHVRFVHPARRIAPGQVLAFYDWDTNTRVLGAALVTR